MKNVTIPNFSQVIIFDVKHYYIRKLDFVTDYVIRSYGLLKQRCDKLSKDKNKSNFCKAYLALLRPQNF